MIACPRCATEHETILACPYVKAVEFADGYDAAGQVVPLITRLEFLTPADYGPARGEKSPDEAEQAGYPKLGGAKPAGG